MKRRDLIRSVALAFVAALAGTLFSAPVATAAPTGEYQLVRHHAWWAATHVHEDRSFTWIAEQQIDTWIPPQEADVWMERRTLTGKRTWIVGTEEEAKAAGIDVEGGWPTGEYTTRYGDFIAAYEGREPQPKAGEWSWPTQEFQAGLPKDVLGLRARLLADARGSDWKALLQVKKARYSGLVGAELKDRLFQALDGLLGVTKVPGVVDADGRTGFAYSAEKEPWRDQIIVDQATGAHLGERGLDTVEWYGVPPGTVLSQVAATTKAGVAMGEY
ncbi:hypothetical protein D5S17_12940 [Pseudonocardiaceae bacterium YIM PH 21723]|nr:hypothetical protein D5S17_12940 [Pseudonocardiaceae bacterium YIM PH 21723]